MTLLCIVVTGFGFKFMSPAGKRINLKYDLNLSKGDFERV